MEKNTPTHKETPPAGQINHRAGTRQRSPAPEIRLRDLPHEPRVINNTHLVLAPVGLCARPLPPTIMHLPAKNREQVMSHSVRHAGSGVMGLIEISVKLGASARVEFVSECPRVRTASLASIESFSWSAQRSSRFTTAPKCLNFPSHHARGRRSECRLTSPSSVTAERTWL